MDWLLLISGNTLGLNAHHLLSSVGWPADGKARFPSLKETLRSLCPFPCLQAGLEISCPARG